MAELKEDSTSFSLLHMLWVLLQVNPCGQAQLLWFCVSVTVPSIGLWPKSHKALGMKGWGCMLLSLLLWLPCDRRITFTRGWIPEWNADRQVHNAEVLWGLSCQCILLTKTNVLRASTTQSWKLAPSTVPGNHPEAGSGPHVLLSCVLSLFQLLSETQT